MRRSRAILLASLLLLGTAVTAFGAGFSLFEQGTKATSMGGAFAATADDPTAIFYNPAGIAYQRKMAATAGGTAINFSNSFIGSGAAQFPGANARANYAAHTFVLPNAYLVVPLGENATVGIGSFSAFGLRTDWENPSTFPGRFLSQDANLKTASVEPALAWKTSNGVFAIGAGAEYRKSHVTLQRNVGLPNPFTGRVVDIAHATLDSEWSDAWGYNVGFMFRPSQKLSIGASYRSDMDIDYKGTARFRQISTGNPQLDAIVARSLPPNQDITTTIKYPAIANLGIATGIIPTWNIEFDAVWMQWNRFSALDVNFAQTPSSDIHHVENWKNSYSYRLGANHPVTDHWDVRLGALMDDSPQPVTSVSPLLPDANRQGVSFGVGYHGEQLSVDVSEFVLRFENRDTLGLHPEFNGIYKTSANLFSVNLGYKF